MSYQAFWGDFEGILREIDVECTERLKRPKKIVCFFKSFLMARVSVAAGYQVRYLVGWGSAATRW